MNVIRSHLHDLYTEEVNKVALSAEDDKKGYYGRRNSYLSVWSSQTNKLRGFIGFDISVGIVSLTKSAPLNF